MSSEVRRHWGHAVTIAALCTGFLFAYGGVPKVNDEHLYLYSRRSRELLIDLHHIGLIDAKTVNGPLLAGPLPRGFGAALARRSYFDHGLLRLNAR